MTNSRSTLSGSFQRLRPANEPGPDLKPGSSRAIENVKLFVSRLSKPVSTSRQSPPKSGFDSVLKSTGLRSSRNNSLHSTFLTRSWSLWIHAAVSFSSTSSEGKTKRKSLPSTRASMDYGDGDPGVQQLLVEMLRLQMGRVRMNDFVEERSQHMREIADQSTVELNRIANRTMKGVDKAGSRVLRELDAGAFAIERELEIARADIEAYEQDCEEFEARAIYSRNEGLFFKSLYPMPKSMSYRKVYARPMQRMKVEVPAPPRKSHSASTYRVIVCSGLSLVLMSFLWSTCSALILEGSIMKSTKLMTYISIVSLLLFQLRFEKEILGVDDEEKPTPKSVDK